MTSAQISAFQANSSIAPAAIKLRTIGLCRAAGRSHESPSRSFAPKRVGSSSVHTMSLTPRTAPASGPSLDAPSMCAAR